MKRILVWSGIVLFAASCPAQKNELDMVLGNTRSFSSNTTFSTPIFSRTVPSLRASNLTYEIGVARQLASFKPASLSLELTSAGFPARGDFASVFVVPAAKFTFLPQNRISPFASTGVGFVHLSMGGVPSTNAVAYQFAGGVDVKTPIRFLSIRGEARDFLASQSGFASAFSRFATVSPGTTVTGSSRNHLLVGGGAVFRF